MEKTWLQRALAPFRKGIFKEMVGRARYYISTYKSRPYRPTVDLTKSDYAFYDKLRRGQADGLTVAGLIVKPILSKIAAWVMGRPPTWKLSDADSQAAFQKWWDENQADILSSYEDSLALGDFFLVFNADGTLTQITPDVVEPIVAEDNYNLIIGWRITERYQHPTETGRYQIEINEYYADKRVRTVEFENKQATTTTYRNLLGVIPVIHVVNNKASNQTNGTPEIEALVATQSSALYRYDDLLDAAIVGNIMKGRATPVIEFNDIDSLNDFWNKNATETKDDDGNTVYEVDFDGDKLLLVVGKFEYKSPGSSAAEAKTLLEVLYWLIVEHTEIPDIIMGTEMGQSRSSGEVQVQPLVKFIEKKRGQAEKWVRPLADLALRWLALMGEATYEPIKPAWEKLTSEDAKLRFEVVQWAYTEALLPKAMALQLAPTLDLDNPEEVVKEAQAEKQEAQDQADIDFEQALVDAQARVEAEPPDPEADPQADPAQDEQV